MRIRFPDALDEIATPALRRVYSSTQTREGAVSLFDLAQVAMQLERKLGSSSQADTASIEGRMQALERRVGLDTPSPPSEMLEGQRQVGKAALTGSSVTVEFPVQFAGEPEKVRAIGYTAAGAQVTITVSGLSFSSVVFSAATPCTVMWMAVGPMPAIVAPRIEQGELYGISSATEVELTVPYPALEDAAGDYAVFVSAVDSSGSSVSVTVTRAPGSITLTPASAAAYILWETYETTPQQWDEIVPGVITVTAPEAAPQATIPISVDTSAILAQLSALAALVALKPDYTQGPYDPSDAVGKDGDDHLNTATGYRWKKGNGSWVQQP